MSELLPVFLKLDGKKVLVVGGGNVALEKLQHLIGTGCDLTLISEEVLPEVENLLLRNGQPRPIQRRIRTSDLEGFHLVYSATNDPDTNRELVEFANRNGIWINCADDPKSCDFYSSAYFDRGPIRVAVSTQGEFAGLAGTLRNLIDELLPAEHDDDLKDLLNVRKLVKDRIGDLNERKNALKGLLADFKEKYLSIVTKS